MASIQEIERAGKEQEGEVAVVVQIPIRDDRLDGVVADPGVGGYEGRLVEIEGCPDVFCLLGCL